MRISMQKYTFTVSKQETQKENILLLRQSGVGANPRVRPTKRPTKINVRPPKQNDGTVQNGAHDFEMGAHN